MKFSITLRRLQSITDGSGYTCSRKIMSDVSLIGKRVEEFLAQSTEADWVEISIRPFEAEPFSFTAEKTREESIS